MDPPQSQTSQTNGPSAQNVKITHFSGSSFRLDSRYQILDLLGAGAYGIVVSAQNTYTGDLVAIKKIQKAFDCTVYAKRTLRELKILRLMSHPNILDIKTIQLPCSLKSMTDLYVMSTLMQTDLGSIIKGPTNLSDQHCQFFMYQLLRGLQYIHSTGIVHRDLKPRNLLVNSNCDLKIADFGLARPLLGNSYQRKQAMTDYVSTRWYRAPELLLETKNYSQAMDVWSAGMIFGELLNRKPVVPGTSSLHQLELIFKLVGTPSIIKTGSQKRIFREAQRLPNYNGNLQQVFIECNPMAIDLLKKMLVVEPRNRISTSQALQHPYFDGLREAEDEILGQHYSMYDFEFQLMKLKMEDIKELIYDEILLYHSEERLQAYQKAKSDYVNILV